MISEQVIMQKWIALWAIVAGISLVSQQNCFGQSDVPAVPSFPIVDGPIDEIMRVELRGLTAGKSVHQSVMLENRSSSRLVLEQVDVSCDCIEAKVPKKEMRSGDIELLEFDFKTDALLDRIEQSHTVTVRCKGARKNIIFVFSGKVEGYLGFRRKDATQSFWKGDELVTFSIPLLVSEGVDLRGVEIRTQESNGFAKVKIETVEGLPFARLELATNKVESKSILIDLQLVKNGIAISEFTLHLHQKDKFEILPTPLLFVPVLSKDVVRRSSSILRMRYKKGEPVPTIHKIHCETVDGAKLPVEFTLLREGVYRLKVEVVEITDMPHSTELKWEFLTTEGSFQTQTKSALSN
jgi:hypothetical protein